MTTDPKQDAWSQRDTYHQARLDAGQVAHERHGWNVALARLGRRLALVLVGIAALALAAWTILSLIR